MDEPSLHDPELAWVQQTRISTGDVKQANLIRQPDGSTALVVDFVGPVLEKLAEDAPVSTRVSVDDNAELVENNLRYNTVTKGWRLTLRVKVRDPARSGRDACGAGRWRQDPFRNLDLPDSSP